LTAGRLRGVPEPRRVSRAGSARAARPSLYPAFTDLTGGQYHGPGQQEDRRR
jgi:hypothetical protein